MAFALVQAMLARYRPIWTSCLKEKQKVVYPCLFLVWVVHESSPSCSLFLTCSFRVSGPDPLVFLRWSSHLSRPDEYHLLPHRHTIPRSQVLAVRGSSLAKSSPFRVSHSCRSKVYSWQSHDSSGRGQAYFGPTSRTRIMSSDPLVPNKHHQFC